MCKQALAKQIDKAIFPGLQGGPHENNIAALAVALAEEYAAEPIYAAIGLHPDHAAPASFYDEDEGVSEKAKEINERGESFDSDFYKKLAASSKVVAVGECGLDYFHIPENRKDEVKHKQKEAFIRQIEFSVDVKKPLIIHCRDAYDDLIQMLNAKKSVLNAVPGIIHFFSGTRDEAEQLLNMGFYFSFGGVITFPPKKGKTDYAQIVKTMPIDRILSETDAPYVAPVPYRGTRNEPAYVIEVVKKLAEMENISLEEMRKCILKNSKYVFRVV